MLESPYETVCIDVQNIEIDNLKFQIKKDA